jgi:hypothetical protein
VERIKQENERVARTTVCEKKRKTSTHQGNKKQKLGIICTHAFREPSRDVAKSKKAAERMSILLRAKSLRPPSLRLR